MSKLTLDISALEVETFETTAEPYGRPGLLYGQTPYPSNPPGSGCTCIKTNCTSCGAGGTSTDPTPTFGCGGPCDE